MRTPVSVAVATCNGAKYISAQLESLLQQHLKPAEIVVCDDASTDGTAAILADYEKRGVITLHQNKTRLGVTENFRKAAGLCADGHFLALCDQDDVWYPEKLAESVAVLEKMGNAVPGLVCSDLSVTDESLQETAPSFWEILNIDPAKETLASLLFGNFITGCTILMNAEMKKIFLEMPRGGMIMHDAWLGLAAFTFGDFGCICKPLVKYRQHGGNVTFATNKKGGIAARIVRNFGQMLKNKKYLAPELLMAQTFYDQYSRRLTPTQQVIFKDFLALRQASFFEKKKKALAGRAYRNHRGI